METLLKGRCDRSSVQNYCWAVFARVQCIQQRAPVCLTACLIGAHRAVAPCVSPLRAHRSLRSAAHTMLKIFSSTGRFLGGIQWWQFDLSRIPFCTLVHSGASRTAWFVWTKRHRGALKRDLESYLCRMKLILHLGGLSEREVLHCKRLVLGITTATRQEQRLTFGYWNEINTALLIMSELSPV